MTQVLDGAKAGPVHRLRFRASGLAVWRPNRDGVAFPASAGPWEITMVMQGEELAHLREQVGRVGLGSQPTELAEGQGEDWQKVGRLLAELLAAGAYGTLHGGREGWEACGDMAPNGTADRCRAPTLSEAVERLHALMMSRREAARGQGEDTRHGHPTRD